MFRASKPLSPFPDSKGQQQRERPQDKKKHKQGNPSIEEVEIEPVDDLMEELEQLKKSEQERCGCWGE